MILLVCSNALGQEGIPSLPRAASCFPPATISRLSTIQTNITSFNQQLATATTPESKVLSIQGLLQATIEAASLYDSAVAGIENSERKENARRHKANAEEQLNGLTNQLYNLSPADSTFELTITTSFSRIVNALNKIDSAFVVVNPCPTKGGDEFYTDNNGQRQVNLSMVNRFKLVWNEANAPLTYDSYTYQSKERDLFTWTDISRLWTNYRFAQEEKKDTAVGNNNANLIAENQQVTEGAEAKAEPDKGNYRTGELRSGSDGGSRGGKTKNLPADKSNPVSNNVSTTPTTLGGKNDNGSTKTREASSASISESDKKIAAYTSGAATADFFTVQIAANTKPLDTKLLTSIYKGQYTIEERLEEGWYRYVVGRFFDVNAAVAHLNSFIDVGMVTAYNGNTRSIVKTKVRSTQSLSTQEGLIAVYRVQIAAAKKPIPAKVLHSLYAGIRPINVYAEDGWFRYSIGDYLLYSDALAARDSSKVQGAFVMPYINGVRQQFKGKQDVQLEEAKRTSNPVYVVQLAATKRPISLKKLKDYRKSGIPVTLHIEDGWYKYTADVFFNKELARKKAKEIKIPGAFVVTYINGKRVTP